MCFISTKLVSKLFSDDQKEHCIDDRRELKDQNRNNLNLITKIITRDDSYFFMVPKDKVVVKKKKGFQVYSNVYRVHSLWLNYKWEFL